MGNLIKQIKQKMRTAVFAAIAAYAAECDATAMSFEGFSDNACETADETITATIEATVEAAAEFYSGECEYMGDEAGVSIIVECNAEGFSSAVYTGDACEGDAVVEQSANWGECFDGGEFSYIATTTQELGAAALAASSSAMVLLATI